MQTHVGVMCYAHKFCRFVKVLYVIVEIIEASMCYVGVINVYLLVLIGWLVGAVKSNGQGCGRSLSQQPYLEASAPISPTTYRQKFAPDQGVL